MADQTLFDCAEQVKEEWRAVVGWEGLYEVSSLGRVKRIHKGLKGGKPGTVFSLSIATSGYPVVSFRKCRQTVRKYVHFVVAEAFLGARPPGFEINHKDGNKTNNLVSNIEYVTRQENIRHAVDTGLRHLAEIKLRVPRISIDKCRAIQADYVAIKSSRKVARMHGVSQPTVLRLAKYAKQGNCGFRMEQHQNAKLNMHQVREIRRRFDSGESCKSLAAEFGVTGVTISAIHRRKTWRYIQ